MVFIPPVSVVSLDLLVHQPELGVGRAPPAEVQSICMIFFFKNGPTPCQCRLLFSRIYHDLFIVS